MPAASAIGARLIRPRPCGQWRRPTPPGTSTCPLAGHRRRGAHRMGTPGTTVPVPGLRPVSVKASRQRYVPPGPSHDRVRPALVEGRSLQPCLNHKPFATGVSFECRQGVNSGCRLIPWHLGRPWPAPPPEPVTRPNWPQCARSELTRHRLPNPPMQTPFALLHCKFVATSISSCILDHCPVYGTDGFKETGFSSGEAFAPFSAWLSKTRTAEGRR